MPEAKDSQQQEWANRLAHLNGITETNLPPGTCKIIHGPLGKTLASEKYNFIFWKSDGFFLRWGATVAEDPKMSPFGPEIADIEVSTACSGIQGTPCKFCYKSNKPVGENMSLETFKKVFAALPPTVTQIAFGIGDIDANPDLWGIFSHCRENNVVPNVTINGARMTNDYYGALASLCGAVAVSRYDPSDVCYDAVEKLCEAGLEQVNIHQLLCEETYESCFQLIEDVKTDPRLKKLRAVVFLALKPQGRGKSFTPLRDAAKYQKLVQKALQEGVGVGFDSCSAPLFLKAVEGSKEYKQYEMLAEPCESTLFSVYVNVEGKMFPCSFLESGFEGIDVTEVKDFLKDVWFHPDTVKWREELLATAKNKQCLVKGCRQCPEFDIY